MKWIMMLTALMLFVIGLSKAQADNKKSIQVLVTIGDSYANALGSVMTSEAQSLAENTLVNALQDQIRYFDFVSSEELATYRIQFHIDNPPTNNPMTMHNIHDYYIFVSLNRDNKPMSPKLNWLFRGAGSNLNGADSALSIAQLLTYQVKERVNNIVNDLLSQVSFTENATFKHQGTKGWYIQHSAEALCLNNRSELRITSIVPESEFDDQFEDEFEAVVKKGSNDRIRTFSIAKDQDAVSSLLDAPEQAKVVAVHVTSYEMQCEQKQISEVSPTAVSFTTGDAQ